MQFGELKLNLWTSIGSQNICIFWIDLKILPHKLEEQAQNFQQIFIEFGHWMQKLQPFELDFFDCEDTFDPLGWGA